MANFLEKIIEEDMKAGNRADGRTITTRFPPEPNGYLHIGHAKSVLTNFGIAKKYDGQCNLRFDDTNPATEETEYVDSIKEDVKWICKALDLPWCRDGKTAPWRDNVFYTSDYFQTLFDYACELINSGKAYVDSQTPEQVQENRGGMQNGVEKPGVNSPFRDRSVEENMKLFLEMQEGKHDEGSHLLRAKIDMNHLNMNMRDPPLYRIKKMAHHRTGDKWNVYPIYDFAHGQSDAIENITHSFCTLEFENHNELYRWFIDNIPSIASRPVQTEFARLNLEGAVMSKRKILRLVKENKVLGWDDPRLMTIAAVRRRGIRPEGIKRFIDATGVTNTNSNSSQPVALFEKCIVDDLDPASIRRMVVLDPLEVDIVSYEGGQSETIEGVKSHPADDSFGARNMTFSNKIFIDRDDLDENAGAEFFRFSKPGTEVKLRGTYCIKLEEIIKDASGKVTSLKCSHDPATKNSMPSDRKVKGVIHWVDANNCLDVECRLVNKLFTRDDVPEGQDFMDFLNPNSMEIKSAKAEKALLENLKLSDRFQFERKAYFAPDTEMFDDAGSLKKECKIVFNRVVNLPESTAKKNMDGKNNASRKEEQERQKAEKERLKKIAPKDYFKSEFADKYSKFDDETGLPTHDVNNEELKKSALKKLQKELDKHKKLYEAGGA